MQSIDKTFDPIERAQAKGWQVVAKTAVQGDGYQAPGFVVMSYTGVAPTPYVVHFFNAQDGGFHNGDYCADSAEATESYAARVARFTRHHKH